MDPKSEGNSKIHRSFLIIGKQSYTIFLLKNAAAFITKSNVWMRRSIEGSLNQRAAFIRGRRLIHIEKSVK